jgi:hypothetical protein
VVEVAPHQPQVGADGLACVEHAGGGTGSLTMAGLARAHDLRLLQADGLAVGAQVLHVVESMLVMTAQSASKALTAS